VGPCSILVPRTSGARSLSTICYQGSSLLLWSNGPVILGRSESASYELPWNFVEEGIHCQLVCQKCRFRAAEVCHLPAFSAISITCCLELQLQVVSHAGPLSI